LLLIVDFAEIENGSLYRFVGRDAMVFYDAEVAMECGVYCYAELCSLDNRLSPFLAERSLDFGRRYHTA